MQIISFEDIEKAGVVPGWTPDFAARVLLKCAELMNEMDKEEQRILSNMSLRKSFKAWLESKKKCV